MKQKYLRKMTREVSSGLVWRFLKAEYESKSHFSLFVDPISERYVNQVENSKQKIRFYHSLVLQRTRFLRYLSIFVFWPSVPLSLSSNKRENIY